MDSDDGDTSVSASPFSTRAQEETLQVGWHADPFGRYAHRWWDGTAWNERVRSATGQAGIDPPGIDVAPVAVTESIPANPIEDALMPIKGRPIAATLAVLLGCLVFLALIAVFVVALTT